MNKLYYHFYIPDTPSHWELLLYEQLDCIEGSKIYSDCEIELCVSSNIKNWKILQKNIKAYLFLKSTWFDTSIEKNKKHSEGTTLLKLYNECKNYKNIGYIHSKGITNLTKYTNKWRKILEYAIIEKYKDNIFSLENGYDVSGIFWLKGNSHFSGNFWWAKSDYIKTLPRPDLEDWDTYSPKLEFWKTNLRYEAWIGIKNPKVNEIFILKSIPIGTGLYGYDLNFQRKTILNFADETSINYF